MNTITKQVRKVTIEVPEQTQGMDVGDRMSRLCVVGAQGDVGECFTVRPRGLRSFRRLEQSPGQSVAHAAAPAHLRTGRADPPSLRPRRRQAGLEIGRAHV